MEYEVFSSLLRYCDGHFGFQLECSNVPHRLLLNHQVHKDTEGYKEEYTVVIMQKYDSSRQVKGISFGRVCEGRSHLKFLV